MYLFYFNRTTINPPIDYDAWDADSILGCVCDEGYEGYNCASRKCPWGIDPTNTKSSSYEKFLLKCQADYGYFSLTILGNFNICLNLFDIISFICCFKFL